MGERVSHKIKGRNVLSQIIGIAERLGWQVSVEGNLFIFTDPEREEYNFKIWAETIGEFIHKVQLLAFNYKEEDKAFSDKLDGLCGKVLKIIA